MTFNYMIYEFFVVIKSQIARSTSYWV